MPYELFISYSRKDNGPQKIGDAKGWVTKLHDEILADHRRFSTEPLRIFFDRSTITDMDDWRHRIIEELRQSRILLVCLSPEYFKSDYCRWEFEEYVQRQVHHPMGHDSFTQVYFVEVPDVSEQEMGKSSAEMLRRTNYTELRPWFPQGLEALRDESVRLKLAALGTTPWERMQRARRASGVPGNLRRVNPHFIGRRTELRQLHEILALGALGVITAVQGLGGQGKTELATGYAHVWADFYPAGIWVFGAEGKETMLPLLGELCAELALPLSAGADEAADQRGRRVLAELKRRVMEVRDRLRSELSELENKLTAARETRRDAEANRMEEETQSLKEFIGRAACLVLLDNVSEPALLAEPQLAQLPREDWLRVVVTTRLGQDTLPAARQKLLAFIAVDALAEDDADRLIEDHQPDAKWPATTGAADAAATRDIVRELDGFTLAVESVAIYLGLHPEIRPADYLARLQAEGLPSVDDLPAEADVAAQMQHREKQLRLVLDQTLARLTPPERTALDYAAFLPPDSIPWPWLRELVAQEHPDVLTARRGYSDPWSALRRRLEGLRLLTPGDHPEVARLHRMLAAHVQERMKADDGAKLANLITHLDASVGYHLQETWEHDPTQLWALSPLQNAVKLLSAGTSEPMLGRVAGLVGDIERSIGRVDRAGFFLHLSRDIATHDYAANPQSAEAARDVSVALSRLGDFYLQRGQTEDTAQALDCFRQSLDARQKLCADNPLSAQATRDVSISLERLGALYLQRSQPGDATQALRYFQQSLEARQKLWAENPQSAQAARDVSVSLDRLADFYLQRGQPGDAAQALGYFQQSLDVRLKLCATNPQSAQAARDVSVSLDQLADFYLQRGQPGDAAQALGCFQQSLEARQKLWADNPQSAQAARDMSLSLHKLGIFYLQRSQPGDAAEAFRCFQQSLETAQKLWADNPQSAQAARDSSLPLIQLGDFYLLRGQPGDAAEAFSCFQQSHETLQKLWADNPQSAQSARDVSMSYDRLGAFYLQRGEPDDAAQAFSCFQRSLEARQKLWADNPHSAQAVREMSMSLNRLGAFYLQRGQPGDTAQALRHFQHSLEARQKLRAHNPQSAQAARDVSVSLSELGDFHVQRGQPGDAAEALRCFQQSLEIAQKLSADNPQSARAARDVSLLLERLGDIYLQRCQPGDGAQALRYFQQYHGISQKLWADNPHSAQAARDVSLSLDRLADSYLQRGQPGDAVQALGCFQQSLEIVQKLWADNPHSAQVARDMSVSLSKLGDFYLQRGRAGDAAQALGCFQKCHETLQKLWADDPQSAQAARDLTLPLERLGACYLQRSQAGDAAEALRCFQQYHDIAQKLWADNPESAQAARDVVASHQRLALCFQLSGQHEQATAHLSECHRVLHELHEAGCSFDQHMQRAYDQLHAQFGG